MLDPLLCTDVEFCHFEFEHDMSTHNVFQNFTIFVRCFTIFIPNWMSGIKFTKQQQWNIIVLFSSSRSSLYNISESLGGIYTLSIKICFPFISSKFEMASRLDYILLTKTLLISSFIKAATPNPSFFLSKS